MELSIGRIKMKDKSITYLLTISDDTKCIYMELDEVPLADLEQWQMEIDNEIGYAYRGDDD